MPVILPLTLTGHRQAFEQCDIAMCVYNWQKNFRLFYNLQHCLVINHSKLSFTKTVSLACHCLPNEAQLLLVDLNSV